MKIGKAAKESGISAKTIRYYESVGLLPWPERLESGYREYGNDEIELLRLVRRARDAGLSPQRAAEVARLWQGSGRRVDVDLANALLAELETRADAARELGKLVRQLLRAERATRKAR